MSFPFLYPKHSLTRPKSLVVEMIVSTSYRTESCSMSLAFFVGLFFLAQVSSRGAALPVQARPAIWPASLSRTLRESEKVCYTGIAPSAFYRRGKGDSFGRGHFAHVYRMVDKNEISWAVKESFNHDEQEQVEIQIMQHSMPFNMHVHEVFFTAAHTYLVMPLLHNGNLKKFASDRADLMSQKWRSIAAQIAFGAWELHQRGYMHLDLSFKNVMLRDPVGDNITLIDYNRANAGCRGKGGLACGSDCALRHAGGIDGSKAWASAMGKPYSYEVGWWSFGVLLHNFSFGKTPWEDSGWVAEGHGGPPFYLRTSSLKGRDPSLVSLLDDTIGLGYLSMKTKERRLAMESPLPEVHPVLSHDFWLADVKFTQETRTSALREYWAGVCKLHAADPEVQCAMLFKEKPAENRPACQDAVVAKCCCRRSMCSRNETTGEISEHGVDEMLAVEGGKAETTVCCARVLECGASSVATQLATRKRNTSEQCAVGHAHQDGAQLQKQNRGQKTWRAIGSAGAGIPHWGGGRGADTLHRTASACAWLVVRARGEA